MLKNTKRKSHEISQIWLIIGLIFCVHISKSQCPEGVLLLSSDEEIMAFAKQYPNCTELDSSLIIGPNQDMGKTRITDVGPLSKITSIAGDFSISGNPWLTSIKALENIELVDGNLNITIQKEMKEEVFESKLLVVNGDMRLNVFCIKCKTKLLFNDLIKVKGILSLYGYESMGHMFPSLWKIGGGLWNMTTSSRFEDDDFPSLRKIEGSLSLSLGHKELRIFNSLNSVDRLELRIDGKNRFNIGNLKECNKLKIDGTLHRTVGFLSSIDSLESLSIEVLNENVVKSLPNLVHVDKIYITTTAEDFDGGFLKLKSTDAVILRGEMKSTLFKELTNIDRIEVSANSDSHILSGFENLEKVNRFTYQYAKVDTFYGDIDFDLEHLNIYDNKQLLSIDLKSSSTVKNLTITRNDNLLNIENLDIIVNPKGVLSITQNKNLNNCVSPTLCRFIESSTNYIRINNNGPDCTLEKIKEGCMLK